MCLFQHLVSNKINFYVNDLRVVDSAVIQSHISTAFQEPPPPEEWKIQNEVIAAPSTSTAVKKCVCVPIQSNEDSLLETSGKAVPSLIVEMREGFSVSPPCF